MVDVIITDERRRWNLFRRRRFTLRLPEGWSELRPAQARRWWRWALLLHTEAAMRAMLRDCLRHVPHRIRRRLTPLDLGGFAQGLQWANIKPQCETLAVPEFWHRGVQYHFPAPKGNNVICMEFPIADEYYKQFMEQQDERSLLLLLATLAREHDTDAARVLRRGDARVTLHSREEAEARAERLAGVPYEVQMQALLYFGGLKAFVHQVYGSWLFEQEDEEEGEDEEAKAATDREYPDFGWWGTYQQVAESGTFGNIEAVHQAFFHDVCVYLVRKRVEAQQQRDAVAAARRPAASED